MDLSSQPYYKLFPVPPAPAMRNIPVSANRFGNTLTLLSSAKNVPLDLNVFLPAVFDEV